MKNNSTVWTKIVSALSGIVYVVFGILMINNPITTLASLSLLMGWVVTISGILSLINAFRFRNHPDANVSFVDGLLLLLLGLMFLFGDFIRNTLVLSYLLVFWIILDSMLQLQFVLSIKGGGWAKILTIILDVIIIVYGINLLFNPGRAEGFLVFSLGFAFIVTGISKVTKVM